MSEFERVLKGLILVALRRPDYTHPEIADQKIEAAKKELLRLYRSTDRPHRHAERRRAYWQKKAEEFSSDPKAPHER